jgi:hypothetical protein
LKIDWDIENWILESAKCKNNFKISNLNFPMNLINK